MLEEVMPGEEVAKGGISIHRSQYKCIENDNYNNVNRNCYIPIMDVHVCLYNIYSILCNLYYVYSTVNIYYIYVPPKLSFFGEIHSQYFKRFREFAMYCFVVNIKLQNSKNNLGF